MNESAAAFERIVTELFHRYFERDIDISTSMITTVKLKAGNDFNHDLYLYGSKNKELMSAVEIKYFRDEFIPVRILRNAAYKLEESRRKTNVATVFVVSSPLDRVTRHALSEEFDHYYIDRYDLLFMAKDYPDIIAMLFELLNISKEDIPNLTGRNSAYKSHVESMTKAIYSNEAAKKTRNNKPFQLINTQPEQEKEYIDLKGRLLAVKPGRDDWSDYENVCIDILKFLFPYDLNGWFKQLRTHDELNRYDLVCRIDSTESVWEVFASQIRSQYVVFEFKNYKDEIKQSQILTTEKYLYENALRKVAIIISRVGPSKNAKTACNGAMREHGKLILNLKDGDLIQMMEETINGKGTPNEYLFKLVDEMLLKLSR